MHRRTRQAWLAIPVILVIGLAIAWAGSQGGTRIGGHAVFSLCGLASFLVNWLVFVPAFAFQTERYFDLTGSLTYLSLVATAVVAGPGHPRAVLVAALVSLWAVRLGSFLFVRVTQDGGDGRMDALKPDFARFLMTWTLQGLWVFLTLSCGLVAMTTDGRGNLDVFAGIGAAMWIAGFAIEAIADRQKRVFRHDPANDGRFITTGLWSWSQHPNYFGEILLWAGIAVIALPTLEGARYATLISPIFVFVLLTRISGIPLLRARGKKKWGEEPAYREYVERTPVLVPRPPRAHG